MRHAGSLHAQPVLATSACTHVVMHNRTPHHTTRARPTTHILGQQRRHLLLAELLLGAQPCLGCAARLGCLLARADLEGDREVRRTGFMKQQWQQQRAQKWRRRQNSSRCHRSSGDFGCDDAPCTPPHSHPPSLRSPPALSPPRPSAGTAAGTAPACSAAALHIPPPPAPASPPGGSKEGQQRAQGTCQAQTGRGMKGTQSGSAQRGGVGRTSSCFLQLRPTRASSAPHVRGGRHS